MKKRIFNLIIIDESGSMQSIKTETINNVNETIQTIRLAQTQYEDQEHFVSLVSFNSNVKTIYDCVPVSEVKELTEDDYSPSYLTALYDAMGLSLGALRPKVADVDKVLVTVVTDGCENASKEFRGDVIKWLINELKAKGWVFAYIGANHDVEGCASKISITNTWNFTATGAGVAAMGEKLNSARGKMYRAIAKDVFSADEANEDFFDDDNDEW